MGSFEYECFECGKKFIFCCPKKYYGYKKAYHDPIFKTEKIAYFCSDKCMQEFLENKRKVHEALYGKSKK